MELNSGKGLFAAFKLICVTAAIAMTILCSYDYSRNEDISEVSFTYFNNEKESIYPQLVLCNYDFSVEVELAKELGIELEQFSFARIYQGDEWNDIVLSLNMDKAQEKFKNNVIDTCIFSDLNIQPNQPQKCQGKGEVSTYVAMGGGKCLILHYKNLKTVLSASIWLKKSMFPNSTRPTGLTLSMIFTLPGQIFYFTDFYKTSWPIQANPANPFAMNFAFRGIEVMRQRNKAGSPCVDWKSFDSTFIKEVLSTVGCTPFYYPVSEEYQNCTTKEDLKKVQQTAMGNYVTRTLNPCVKLQKMQMDFKEEQSNVNMEKKVFAGIDGSLRSQDSWFRVTLQFPETNYKNIQQMRAYSAQSLIGNAGGYVGLFVGYTVSEFPLLLMTIYNKLKALCLHF